MAGISIAANAFWIVPVQAASNPELVSLDNSGGKLTAYSSQVSDDGSKVAFMSYDRDGVQPPRIYLRDRSSGATLPASTDSNGDWLPIADGVSTRYELSGNGQKLLLNQSDAVYVKDLQSGSYEAVSLGPDNSPVDPDRAYISDDGLVVAWGNYVRNLLTGTTTELSGRAVELSGDGRYVFLEDGIKVDLTDMSEQSLPLGGRRIAGVSDDGQYVLLGDIRNVSAPSDLRRYDTVNQTTMVVVSEAGKYFINGELDMSGDGNVVAFSSFPYNNNRCCQTTRNRIFVKNIATDEEYVATKNVYGNPADQTVFAFSDNMLTDDGSQLTYASHASNLGVLGPQWFLAYIQDVENEPPVNEDTVAPEITGTPTLSATSVDQGEQVTVTATGTDDNSGVAYGEFYLWDGTSPPTFAAVIGFPGQVYLGAGDPMPLVNGELVGTIDTTGVTPGTYYVQVRIQDLAGNWSQEVGTQLTIEGEVDTEIPVVGTPNWSLNPKTVSQTSTLTVSASDDLGVVGGEYYLGDADPGQGDAIPMGWDGTDLSAVFGTDLPTGVHKVTVRAADGAGNWSEPVTDYLVVYNPNGARMTGKKSVIPSLANGDVLPGLVSANQTDKASFGFNVKYNNQGQITNGSDMQFKYKTGSHCNGNHPQNCHEFELNATVIAWLTTQGANDSTGIFQGTATLNVDGIPSVVTFRVTGLDGGRLDPVSDDHFALSVYPQGANPNTDQSLYQVSAQVSRGNIKIIF